MHIGLLNLERKRTKKNYRRIFVAGMEVKLPYIAAVFPEKFDIEIQDEFVTGFSYKPYDIAIISVYTNNASRSYDLATKLRKDKTHVVMIGKHVEAMPEEAMQYADTIVLGELEKGLEKLVKDLESNTIKKVYNEKINKNLSIKQPRWDLYKTNALIEIAGVGTSRGCPRLCNFCNSSGDYRKREIEEVITELIKTKERTSIIAFKDPNFGVDREHYKELMTKIIPLKLNWGAQTDISVFNDEEFLDIAKDAGCLLLEVGLESISKSVRGNYNKMFIPDQYSKLIKNAHKKGIAVRGNFMFGSDNDDINIFDNTVKFAQDLGLELTRFSILVPVPGTQYFTQFQKEGRLLYTNFPQDWKHYNNGQVTFTPKNMTPRELQQGYYHAWKKFYSPTSIIKRLAPKFMNKSMYFTLLENVPSCVINMFRKN